MLKRILSISLTLALILSISSFAVFNVSAAAHPNWEVFQDFESATDTSMTANVGSDGPADVASIVTGAQSIYGKGSLKYTTSQFGSGWSGDIIANGPPAATIASPSGYFFRLETNGPLNASMLPMDKGLNWADWGDDTVFVGDDGTVIRSGKVLPTAGFSGYVFVPVSGMTASKCTAIGFLLCGWNKGVTWGKAYLEIDNIGYYSVPASPANADYAAIVTSLNSNYTINPIAINGLSTGTYKDFVLTNAPVQMQAEIVHPIGAFTWTSSNVSVATVDSNGLVTPKAVGTTDITVVSANNPDATATCTISVTYGWNTITCTDNDNTDKASYGIKMRLRAVPSFVLPDTNIKWSVVSGPATIETTAFDPVQLDKDIASASNVQCALVNFTDTGTIVVRAAFAVDANVYTDYTFNVSPSYNDISLSLISAKSLVKSKYSAASWSVFDKAYKTAVALANAEDPKTKQSVVNDAKSKLDTAVKDLVLATAVNDSSAASSSSTSTGNGEIPDTGSSSNPVMPLIIAAIALGAVTFTVKKSLLK